MNGGGGIWSRRSIARIVALAIAVILLVAFLWPRPTLNRIAVDGHPFFLAGVNYPWKTGQDFGTGGWGHSGVSDPTTKAEVEADFTNMASLGVGLGVVAAEPVTVGVTVGLDPAAGVLAGVDDEAPAAGVLAALPVAAGLAEAG